MRKYLQTSLYELSFYIEILISLVLTVTLLALTARLITDLSTIFSASLTISDYLNDFLSQAMTIAVGVELIKMLSKHTSATIIEVLLFAIARQVVIVHGSSLDTLLSILSIAILFATRKYLFTSFDDATHIIVRASQKIKLVDLIAKVDIPGNKKQTLRDYMTEKLREEEKSITIGSSLYFNDMALRIDSIKDGKITRVEVIKSL
jgi:hypothetical protein